jgi:CHASE2 domain-containing sensor protein
MAMIKNVFSDRQLLQLRPKGIFITMAYSIERRGKLATVWVLLASVVILLAAFRVAQPLDLRLLDAQFKVLRSLRISEPAQEVALIGIDERTLAAFPEPMALWHKHIGELLTALTQVNPAAVGLDIVLPDRSYENVLMGSDRALIRGLILARQSYPLVLGLTIDSAGHARPVFAPFLAAAGPDASGFVLVTRDPDNIVRRFETYLDEGSKVTTFVGQIARRLDLDPASGFIDYSVGAALDYIPMHALLDAYRNGKLSDFQAKLEGRIVLIGPALPLEDRALQPVLLAGWEQGRRDAPALLVHAQAIRSIGSGLIREMSPSLPVALALLGTLLWFVSTTPSRAIVLLVLLSAGVSGISFWLLAHRSFLPVAMTLCGLWSAALGRLLFEAMEKLQQRRHLRGALAGYVGPQIVKEVLSGRLAAGLGGRRALICVVFADIRGFTPRSETMTPEAVVDLLNLYFEEVIDCVHRHHGTIAQLMGDGLMAFFGAPNPLDNPSRAAFAAAQDMFQRLEGLNLRLRTDCIEPIEIGIGPTRVTQLLVMSAREPGTNTQRPEMWSMLRAWRD